MKPVEEKKSRKVRIRFHENGNGKISRMNEILQFCKLTEIWEKVCFWGCVKAGNEKLYRIYTD